VRFKNPLRHISLRWRITLLSTLIVGVVFVLFTFVAYLTARNLSDALYAPMYNQIDGGMRSVSDANLFNMFYRKRLNISVGGTDQLGPIYLVILDMKGKPLGGQQYVPIADGLFQQALASDPGVGIKDTVPLPNGSRARVLVVPIDWLSPETGELERQGVLLAATRLDLLDQFSNQVRLYFILIGVILLLIVGVGSYLVTGRALRAVNNVAQQARKIETSHDLSQRIRDPGTDDEIGDLVKTFNQMLERLEMAFAAQRRFVADSSHELRTPITVIRGNLHLLRKAKDPDERTELLNITEGEISRLNRMVNDLLYMAQMQAGYDLKPVLRPVELDGLILDVFALARSMAALKDQRIVLVHEDVATVPGDRDQLQHLLLNLIDNAVKYTPQGGVVTLGLWADEGWARIEVGDTGPGVNDEEVPLLFDRFYRTQEARKTARDGAGLGLSIVKAIADAHNGRVEVYSKVGEGTTFRIWLPMSPVGPPRLPRTSGDDDQSQARVRRVKSPIPTMSRIMRSRAQEET
jgi:signal transduction histidine kinase